MSAPSSGSFGGVLGRCCCRRRSAARLLQAQSESGREETAGCYHLAAGIARGWGGVAARAFHEDDEP
jgi:hypothetical protein